MSPGDPRRRAAQNPFFVLELSMGATSAEVERAGQRLLDALALGFPGADRYASPLGSHERTSELVREALGELRDPERRVQHEIFVAARSVAEAQPEGPPAWPEAFAALGWGGPR